MDVKLPPALHEKVKALVQQGLYLSMSDFGRAAVREKIIAMGLARAEEAGAREEAGQAPDFETVSRGSWSAP